MNSKLASGHALALVVIAAVGGCNAAQAPSGLGGDGPGKGDDAAPERTRIDRFGRPEITNFTIRDPQTKVTFNADDPFDPVPGVEGKPPPSAIHAEYLAAGIIFWDGLDEGHYTQPASTPGPYQWADESLLGQTLRSAQKLTREGRALLSMLSRDYLTVDTSKPCDVNTPSYLALELGATDSCGGRTPNDDVIDTYVTLLVGGVDNARGGDRTWGDGVAGDPRQAATNSWPYLPAPFRAE